MPDIRTDFKSRSIVDFDDAIRRYRAGETASEIARVYGVSNTAINVGLRKRGIPTIAPKRNPRPLRTHCRKGHEYTPENTIEIRRGDSTTRDCRECQRLSTEKQRAANVARGLTRHGTVPGAPSRYPKKAPAIEATCSGCGEKRTVAYYISDTTLCKACQFKQMRSGVTKKCEHCGDTFYVPQKRVETARWCSNVCKTASGFYQVELRAKMSATRKGAGNPAFKHGRRIGVQIPGWKLSIKGEDCCRRCGSHDNVQLHHAIPRSKAPSIRTDLRNGLPLCRDCHMGWHYKKLTVYRDVFTPDEWAFLSAVNLTGENVGPWLDKHYPARLAAVA